MSLPVWDFKSCDDDNYLQQNLSEKEVSKKYSKTIFNRFLYKLTIEVSF